MTLELITELMPGAGPPLTTIPKHLREESDDEVMVQSQKKGRTVSDRDRPVKPEIGRARVSH